MRHALDWVGPFCSDPKPPLVGLCVTVRKVHVKVSVPCSEIVSLVNWSRCAPIHRRGLFCQRGGIRRHCAFISNFGARCGVEPARLRHKEQRGVLCAIKGFSWPARPYSRWPALRCRPLVLTPGLALHQYEMPFGVTVCLISHFGTKLD